MIARLGGGTRDGKRMFENPILYNKLVYRRLYDIKFGPLGSVFSEEIV